VTLINRRLFALFAAGLLALGLNTGYARAQASADQVASARQFIGDFADKAQKELLAENLSKEEAAKRFGDLLNEGFDIDTIGRFVLGTYWRQASDEQQKTYLDLFGRYLTSVYSSRLSEYRDIGFSLGDARPIGNNDVAVTTDVKTPQGQPAKVEWRVRQKGDTWKIVDVVVEGVSMGASQRSEFASVIQRSGKGVDGLIDALRQRVG
jgi:phospholipid transport system substrate-binding protein